MNRRLRIVPRNHFDRVAGRLKDRRIFAHHGLPLRLRHRMFAHVKRRKRHAMLRAFVPVSLSALAVDVVLLWLLVPRHGLPGAATASALSWTWRTASASWIARGHR